MIMAIPEFNISLGGSTLLFFFLLLVGSIGAIMFYRTTIPPLAPRRKLLLTAIRTLALTLLIMLLFEPAIKLLFREEKPPVLAVLIDESQSMTIQERAYDRRAETRALMAGRVLESVPAVVRYYGFSSKMDDVTSVDSLRFDGEATDIASALARLKELQPARNIQAAILVSDGNFTVGKNPVAAAEDLGMPLYTIGVGDTAEPRDVLVSSIATNKIVYAETRVPVDVRLRGSGVKDDRVQVVLVEGEKILDRKVVQLQQGTREYDVSLAYDPSEEGVHRYSVAISPIPGELTEKNNTMSFFSKVLRTKLRITLLAGAPSPDVAIVRQTLSEDPHVSVKALVQKGPEEFYEGRYDRSMIDSSDCLVLVGFPSGATSARLVEIIRDGLLEMRKPVLFIAARTLDYEKLRLLEAVLPVTWSNSGSQEVMVSAEVAEKHRMHGLVHLEDCNDCWQQLPPVFKSQTVFKAKVESEVLAFARIRAVVLGEPLVVIRNVARQKSVAITAYGIWRWRLTAQGNAQTEKFFSLFLSGAVRWLTTLEESKQVRVMAAKEVFPSSEPVEFTGEVYDDQFRPVDNAELRLQIVGRNSSAGQPFDAVLRNIGNGRYEGSLDGLVSGDYTFTAKALAGDLTIGEDRGRFVVGQTEAEFLVTRMNKPLLEQLAFRTGGGYADIAHVDALADSIASRSHFRAQTLTHTNELELWNWQYLAGLLVLLLSTEWFVRKLSGMV